MKNTLLIGASLNPNRYSYFAIKRLVDFGISVKAIGQRVGTISGVVIDVEKEMYVNIHTVTLYLSPANQPVYYDYIIALKPQRVIFNPGTENPEFYKKLKDANIPFESACTLVLLSTNQY